MLFHSIDFIMFFPIVLIGYYLIPHKARYLWLLGCSYYFYMSWNAAYALLLLFSTAVTYISALALEKCEKKRKTIVALCVGANLLLLGYFKYLGFCVESLNALFDGMHIRYGLRVPDILLPVGISFYTFQALGYMIDVYRKEIPAEKNFFRYALFVSFFPQLVAGPIERSKNLLAQIGKKHPLSFQNLREGALLMLWGYLLKLVIADRAAVVVDTVYADVAKYHGLYIVVATMLFGIQIYCDFNGYTLIAKGCVKVMGFELMDNFAAPYFAKSVSEFWRRWHISLTSWFRDYLYIPLGGNRKGAGRKYLNTLLVFLVSGLWHGASWSYVVWGGINGLYQVIGDWIRPIKEKWFRRFGIEAKAFSHKILQVLFTFFLVDFSWLFFRAGSMAKSIETLKNSFYFNPHIFFDGSLYALGLEKPEFTLLLAVIVLLFVVDYFKYKGVDMVRFVLKQGLWFRVSVYAGLFWTVVMLGIYGVGYDESAFIYFQF